MTGIYTKQLTWREAVKEVEAVGQEINQNYSIMTEYERITAQQRIAATRARYEKTIRGGSIAELRAAHERLKAAERKLALARTKEIVSWDLNRLNGEITYYRGRIGDALQTRPADARAVIESLVQETEQAADKYKVRALAETLENAVQRLPGSPLDEDRRAINGIAKAAQQTLATLRLTQEKQAAWEECRAAEQARNGAIDAVSYAAGALGKLAPNGNILDTEFLDALKEINK